MIHEDYKKFKFHYSQIKFYWNTVIHLFIDYGCFSAIIAELNSCDRAHVATKPNLLSGPLQKNYADPYLRVHDFSGYKSQKTRTSY